MRPQNFHEAYPVLYTSYCISFRAYVHRACLVAVAKDNKIELKKTPHIRKSPVGDAVTSHVPRSWMGDSQPRGTVASAGTLDDMATLEDAMPK